MPKKEKTERQIDEILELLPWPKELRAGEPYVRLHDDHDGTYEGELMVYITPDGDAWVSTDGRLGHTLRFRTSAGGGNSPLVRNALVLLALAIKRENERKPNGG
jgi:hypothetical protein